MKSKKSNSTKSDTTYNLSSEPYSFKVGKIVGFRGLKGEMKVLPSTNSLDILLAIESVSLETAPDVPKPIAVKSIRKVGKMISLLLEGFSDRSTVEMLKDKMLYTQNEQLLDLLDDEWWSSELVGLIVLDDKGVTLGKISEIYGDEGQFLEIELAASGEKKLIPFIKEFVPEIDIEKGQIKITPPEGLFD